MSIVAKRYAQALMNLALKEKTLEKTAAGLDDMADLLRDSESLASFFSEAKVSQGSKEAAAADLLDKVQAPPLVNTFVRFITRKRRLGLLDAIRVEFHRLADERMGRAHADVTVVDHLSQQQQDALRSRLETLSGKQVDLTIHTDPDILGGMVARIGSTVWDGSLRNQLNKLQQSIIEE